MRWNRTDHRDIWNKKVQRSGEKVLLLSRKQAIAVEARPKRYGAVTAQRASGKERITTALGSIHNVEAGATREIDDFK